MGLDTNPTVMEGKETPTTHIGWKGVMKEQEGGRAGVQGSIT